MHAVSRPNDGITTFGQYAQAALYDMHVLYRILIVT